jgi:hypothetical protein
MILAAVQPVHLEQALEEQARSRAYELRLTIRPSPSAEPGECLDLGADDLRVLLRGQPLAPERLFLDREPRRALHALLIDTSGSMSGDLGWVRAAASAYVEQLRTDHERALVATFDDSVLLQEGPTADTARLASAIARIRPGNGTALHDGLYDVIRELELHRERPVLLLLSDGADTTSLQLREDVEALLARRPDLTIFAIGFDPPPLVGAGAPSGHNSIRGFLQRLARRTSGRYFEVPTGPQLERIYLRIREILDSEAVLTVIDPSPEEEAGVPRVRARDRACRVVAHALPLPAEPESSEGRPPRPNPRTLVDGVHDGRHTADPFCVGREESQSGKIEAFVPSLWFVRPEPQRVSGCALDVTLDLGVLYNPFPPARIGWTLVNDTIGVKTRRFDLRVAPLDELPGAPERLMDDLARSALAVAGDEIEIHPRNVPREEHARPFHDVPALRHGRAFFDLRPQLARGLFLTPELRDWVLERLGAEAQRDLDELAARFRRRAPDSAEAAIRRAVADSDEGRRIAQRASAPTDADLERYLAAWLGDVAAHDLFVRWEALRLERELAQAAPFAEAESFRAEWKALRDLLFVPSYARVLALLSPVYDRETQRIGFWRVVLPRPGWIERRLRRQSGSSEWRDLPLDLVPDRPLGYRVAEHLLGERPDVLAHLREAGYRVRSVAYELPAKPYRQNPRTAFRRARVRLVLEGPAAGAAERRLEVEAEVFQQGDTGPSQLAFARVDARGDPVLEAWAREAPRTAKR